MGLITHTITMQYQAGASSVKGQTALTYSGECNLSTLLSANTSNQVESIGFTISQLEGCAILCTGDLTLTPYNATSAGTPIVLAANTPLIWTLASGVTCPIAGAGLSGVVTSFKLSSTAGGTFTYLSSVNTGS